VRAGGAVLAAPIAPYAATRQLAREACQASGGFFEVYIAASIETCEARDRKGLYARARAGTLKHFTGIDDPYEEPQKPDVRIDTANTSVAQAVDVIMERLVKEGFIREPGTRQ
jgi:sulfate adenylyltransferase